MKARRQACGQDENGDLFAEEREMIEPVITPACIAVHSAVHGVIPGCHHGQHQCRESTIRHRAVFAYAEKEIILPAVSQVREFIDPIADMRPAAAFKYFFSIFRDFRVGATRIGNASGKLNLSLENAPHLWKNGIQILCNYSFDPKKEEPLAKKSPMDSGVMETFEKRPCFQ